MPLTAGTRLGPYEIQAAIGAGGMGEVYKARDTRLGRTVAIKVLPEELAAHKDRLTRFEQEARATAALSHPNILALFDVGVEGDVHYVVEELLEGETLRDCLKAGPLPVRKALDVALQVTSGLGAAHEKGIIHRDLKPANLFVTTDGHVKILDFGLAKLAAPEGPEGLPSATTATRITEAGAALGTVGYMSPEQVRGLAVDQRSDIFALGCVLYELLSGRRAFSGATTADTISAILNEDPAPLTGLISTVPTAVQSIVNRCLEKRAGDRFQSARDLSLAFQAEAEALLLSSGAKPADHLAARRRLSFETLARPRVALPVLLVAVLVFVGGLKLYQQRAKAVWARSEAIPEVLRLADKLEYWQAFLLARRVEAVLTGDPVLARVWPRITYELPLDVKPADAEVYAGVPGSADTDFVRLGRADGRPRVPKGYTGFRFERPGFETLVIATATDMAELSRRASYTPAVRLRPKGELPPRMARIEYWHPSAAPPVPPVFLMDMYEVTNREFKAFVDAEGYRRREFWKHEFREDGRTLSWDDAMALMRDSTGRPGPATWELGTYREGWADYPVTGVSWYEAAAYADFVGKRLPSVRHWDFATGGADPYVIQASNFSGSLAPVGSHRGGVNAWGLYDTAGNAREWCSTAAGEMRSTRGAACNDPSYLFNLAGSRPPLDRNPTTGFRCMKLLTPTSASDEWEAPLPLPVDWSKERPFSDGVWDAWKAFLSYATTPLEANTELVDDTPLQWRMEKVSFTAAYAGERIAAYLFVPRNGRPPYQALVYWPGAAACQTVSSGNGRNLVDAIVWEYFVRDGRALIYPVLKDTYERGNGQMPDEPRERIVTWTKDTLRAVDYLESRSDIDKARIGYLGFSWGAQYGPLVCAADQRLRTCLLLAGGIYQSDAMGWARRVRQPVLMINGRYDTAFPYREAQLPLFRALGTPEADKQLALVDADHSLAGREKEVMTVTLQWLDKYLGPLK